MAAKIASICKYENCAGNCAENLDYRTFDRVAMPYGQKYFDHLAH